MLAANNGHRDIVDMLTEAEASLLSNLEDVRPSMICLSMGC